LGLLGTKLLPANYPSVAIGSLIVAALYVGSQWRVFRNSKLYGYVRQQLTFLERPVKQPDLVTK
jgi:hypothetical protein